MKTIASGLVPLHIQRKRETPRLCRGGSSSLTFPAVHQRSSNVSSHSHERNSADGRVREAKATRLGTANIMLSSSRNVGERRCIRSCVGIWAKCSAGLRSRRN